MTGKRKSAELFQNFEHIFSCPHCESPMKVVHSKSIVCSNNHTFDFAKQGYVNMLTRPANNQYNKTLFQARHAVIADRDFYSLLHETIARIINENTDYRKDIVIFDAGCGEGSHLNKILEKCGREGLTGIGLDISKEGIRMAAGRYNECLWLVGDLANPPLSDHSCHVILNILSPANYKEFKRLLAPDGLVIKVVPRSNYLRELRMAFFAVTEKKPYSNEKIVALFSEHFRLVNKIRLDYKKKLSRDEITEFLQMTPLSWHREKDAGAVLGEHDHVTLTVDLDILIGKKK